VASNRGPVSYQFGADGSLTGSRGGGGMIAGVADGLAALGPEASATWICAALSDADRAVARARDTSDGNGIEVRMLDIAPDIFDRAYNRVANSALWFLLHQLFDTPNQPRFGREFRRDWESYLAYNEAFADALTGEALTWGEGGLRVLIQDYHLCLAPRLLRDRLGGQSGEAGIGHFCHTPWAPPDYYRMLPDDVGRALLDGILGADRAGFHAER
jgi:trehalose 6-phosphate synthase